MKLILLIWLSLSYISFASCQFKLSPALVSGRAQFLRENYHWYQKLDASYFKVYTTLEKTLIQKLAPLIPALKNLKVTFEKFPKDNLSQEAAEKLASLSTYTNQTFNLITSNTLINFFFTFRMMPLELTIVANQLKNAIDSSLSSVFSNMSFEPIGDSCVNKILSRFTAIYKPYANKLLKLGDKIIADFSVSTKNLTKDVQSNVIETRTLIKKLNSCGKLASREFCTGQIVEQNATYQFEISMVKPFFEAISIVSTATTNYQNIVMSSDWLMKLSNDTEVLKTIC